MVDWSLELVVRTGALGELTAGRGGFGADVDGDGALEVEGEGAFDADVGEGEGALMAPVPPADFRR